MPNTFSIGLSDAGLNQRQFAGLLHTRRPDVRLDSYERKIRRWASGETLPDASVIMLLEYMAYARDTHTGEP